MNDLKNVFSSNLKKLMANHGESVADLASSIGIAYSTVSDWKNCKKMPRSGALQKLADHYHINASDLLEDKTPDDNETPQFRAIQRKAKKLSAKDQDLLLSILERTFRNEFGENNDK